MRRAFQRELITLGTSSQVPTRSRNHNGYILRLAEQDVLIDPGEGTQQQLASAEYGVERIRTILVTHFHGDHSLGLAGVFVQLARAEVRAPIRVVFPASGQAFFERQVGACIYDNPLELVPVPVFEPGPVFADARLSVRAEPLSHGVETYGYRLQEGGEGGVLVAHVMDTRRCPGAEALAEGVDLLLMESTYQDSETREALERGHLTARQAAQLAKDAGAGALVLSHFSQRYPGRRGFKQEAAHVFPKVKVARDLGRYPFAATR